MAKEIGFKQGEYKEAVDYFKQKINIPTKRWNSLKGAMHTRAFTIAGAMRADILLDFRNAVDKAISNGDSLQEFRDNFYKIASKWRESDPSFDEKMKKPKYGAWRSKVIYQTNMLTAAAAAQERQARELPDVFTHAKYVCMMLPGSREEHKQWNGTVLPVNDPWWDKHSPPNGFGCLCEKEFISKYEMKNGLEKETKAPTPANDTTNIGENWDYSIGSADAENQRLKAYTQEKEEKVFKKYPEARKNAKVENTEKTAASTETELDLSKIKTVYEKPLNQSELQKEREKREKEFDKIIQSAQKNGIEFIKVEKLAKPLSEKQIVEKLGGWDNTDGSCSSQALAYIANKFGYDVKDYKGDLSCSLFGDDFIKHFTKVGGFAASNYNGFKNVETLLQHVEPGKEYYFTSGDHAVIIRKKGNTFQYLELQYGIKKKNGFHLLTESALKIRFGTKKSKTINGQKGEWHDYLIDIEKLKDSHNFRKMLGFINTQRSV